MLSVVIPAYNEVRRLGPTLESVVAYLSARDEPHEILVADDGSTDGTAALAERWSASHVRVLREAVNHGKGHAVRRGVLASRGDVVLVSDADLSTPIREVERVRPLLAAGAD